MNNEFEFKGTNEPWFLDKRAYCCVTSSKGLIANCGSRTSNVDSEQLHIESTANALLISKAPELFETVEILLDLCKAFGGNYVRSEIKAAKILLKECTEI